MRARYPIRLHSTGTLGTNFGVRLTLLHGSLVILGNFLLQVNTKSHHSLDGLLRDSLGGCSPPEDGDFRAIWALRSSRFQRPSAISDTVRTLSEQVGVVSRGNFTMGDLKAHLIPLFELCQKYEKVVEIHVRRRTDILVFFTCTKQGEPIGC